ncbi:MAG: cytochrome c oxidase subunit II [Alphaproteobacteria bacterium]
MRLTRLFLTGSAIAAFANTAFAAIPVDGDIGFQEAVTPVMERLTWFHNTMVFPIIAAITIFVTVLLLFIMIRFREKANPVPSKTSHNALIEIIWTIAPVAILLVMVVPSMQLLYLQDDIPEAEMTIKATGNTWNWEYSYPGFENIDSFVSNVLEKEDAIAAGKPYLLGSDAPLVVPVDTVVKVLVTSNNNIHAFAMPAFGIKIDAVPGRINETWFKVNAGKEGTYYGQCSEICGVRHAYMPIEIKVVSKSAFEAFVANDGVLNTDLASNVTGGTFMSAAKK